MRELVILGNLYHGHTLSIQQGDFRRIFYQHNPSDDWIEPVGGGVSWSIESKESSVSFGEVTLPSVLLLFHSVGCHPTDNR